METEIHFEFIWNQEAVALPDKEVRTASFYY